MRGAIVVPRTVTVNLRGRYPLPLRVDPIERATLQRAAASRGMPFSTWARKVCDEAAGHRPYEEAHRALGLSLSRWVLLMLRSAASPGVVEELAEQIERVRRSGLASALPPAAPALYAVGARR